MSQPNLIVADARNSPFTQRAQLVYCDPPYNIGFNELAADDKVGWDEYITFCREWIDGVISRNLATNAYLIICCYYKIRWVFELLMRLHHLHFMQEIIWEYNFGVYTRRKFVPQHDNILVYRQGRPKFNWEAVAIPSQRLLSGDPRGDERGRTPGSVWHIPRVPGNSGDRAFIETPLRSSQPIELCERILLAYSQPGDIVFDPFAGNGTMAVACQRYGRQYIGHDISPHYVEEAKKRIATDTIRTFMGMLK